MGNGGNTTSAEEDAESLVWNNAIAPLLQQLEAVAAGSVGYAIKCKHMTYINLGQMHAVNQKSI